MWPTDQACVFTARHIFSPLVLDSGHLQCQSVWVGRCPGTGFCLGSLDTRGIRTGDPYPGTLSDWTMYGSRRSPSGAPGADTVGRRHSGGLCQSPGWNEECVDSPDSSQHPPMGRTPCSGPRRCMHLKSGKLEGGCLSWLVLVHGVVLSPGRVSLDMSPMGHSRGRFVGVPA